MQAIILAGGLGTRLRKLHPDRPKALVPVAGRPFLDWQFEWLRRQGTGSIHLILGHMAEAVQDWVAEQDLGDLQVSSSVEPTPMGTAGAIKFARASVDSDPFLVLNGDSLMPRLVLADLVAAQQSRTAGVTIAVTRIERAGRYGTVEFDASGQLTAFREKAAREAGWINGGMYAMSRAVLDGMEETKPLSLETDVFPGLVARGLAFAFEAPPPLLDMGTEDGLKELNRYLAHRNHL